MATTLTIVTQASTPHSLLLLYEDTIGGTSNASVTLNQLLAGTDAGPLREIIRRASAAVGGLANLNADTLNAIYRGRVDVQIELGTNTNTIFPVGSTPASLEACFTASAFEVNTVSGEVANTVFYIKLQFVRSSNR
jgi:hypothetical protein